MKKIIKCGIAALLAASASWAGAQNFPTKSLRMIIHFPPGGPTDFVGRALAQKLGEAWKQQVVVENRPGAGGVIGIETVLRAPPDGYTLLFGTGGSLALAPALNPKLPYNVFTDLAPITLLVINPQILVVHPSLPVRSVTDLIKLAKAKPGQINYGSVGPGSPQHMGMELLKSMAGVNLVHIPYKGTAPAMTELIAGQISAMFNSMPSVLPHIATGRLRGIAVGSAKRSPAAPDIPTVAESGLKGFQYVTWYALLAHAGVPRDIIARINAESVKALSEPEMAKRFSSQGAEPAPSTPEELGKFMRSEFEDWKRVIKTANIKLE
ncbi:MAG: tripartite tricarboxylate transporter substrate binding protein [Burkholderiales bacterium]|nr:tripartite tricarboxylate transporter substrate binding protein [Burkholderiales bacterium]